MTTRKTLHNYAHTMSQTCEVCYPATLEEFKQGLLLAQRQKRAVTIQGGSCSYGDSAMPTANSIVINTTRLNKILNCDWSVGRIRVEAGVRLAEILIESLPRHWILPVVPGEHQVTVGGAISNNVHGKWSWRYGNFATCVHSMNILLANGDMVTATQQSNADLFNAFIAGIGGLGVLIEAELQLVQIPSAYIEVDVVSTANIQESLKTLESSRQTHDLFLAWCDMFPRGLQLGRGFVERGRFITTAPSCTGEDVRKALYEPRRVLRLIPFEWVWLPLRFFWGRRFVKYINMHLFRSGRRRHGTRQQMLVTDFLFIHKKIPNMVSVYRPHGYYEFQPLLPRSHPEAVSELIELCQKHKFESLLCGIKLHQSDTPYLSYSGDGYSVGIDVHAGEKSTAEVQAFIGALVSWTVQRAGRIFLAKDQWLPAHSMPALFPRFRNYVELKRKYDPHNIFVTKQIERVIGGY